MKKFITRRGLTTFAATGAAVVVTSFVFAAWTTNGTGSATTKAGNASALSTVDASASTDATLYPGVSGDVTLRISNPNAFPVRVTAVSLNGDNSNITADAGHSGCSPTGVSFTDQTGLTIDVPAKSGGTNGAATATLTGAAAMSNASVNACQGATFTVPVTLTGSSSG